MAKNLTQKTTKNRILARLSAQDFGLIQSHLKFTDLPVRTSLESANKPIKHVYFVERGIVSVVANGMGTRGIEVGIIGPEGMTGLAVIMGVAQSTNETFVQVAGEGQRMTTAILREAISQSTTLHSAFLRYGYGFLTQTARTALANGRSKIEERLARWLLMAHDRIEGNELPLTHEFLSIMLGVRRAGVTVALNILADNELIRARRGVISILDRAGLESISNGAYGTPEATSPGRFG